MTYRFVIPGLLPGLNEYTEANRRNKYAAAKMKHQAETAVIMAAKKQLRGLHITRPVTLRYVWVEKNRKRDHDNVAFAQKFVQDALVKAKILKNDGWNYVQGFTHDFSVDKERPRVEVTIEVEEGQTANHQ